MRAAVFAGTRPEFLKLGPVVGALRARGTSVELVATGQHRGPAMAEGLLAGQGLEADRTWRLPDGEGARCGALLHAALDHFAQHHRDLDVAVVQGDTYTAPLVAMAARRHGVPVAHVEAGLRSHNERSQEELNRRMVADLATVHFAPTATAFEHLRAEGVPADRIHVVGNTICDVLLQSGVVRVPAERRRGVLFTAHRATNVDDPARLATLVRIVGALADGVGPVVFPVHPRTADRLADDDLTAGLRRDGVELVAPLTHDDLLDRLARSELAVTDSGGIQEEAAWLGVPTIVLRATTPRWEGVHAGFAELCGLDVDAVLGAAARLTAPGASERLSSLPCPYGDGRSAARIADALVSGHAAGRLTIDEPELAATVPEGAR